MSINCIALGKRICFYRLKFNITQEKLAALTNCSREYIAYLESGTKTPSLPTLIDLANVLHTLNKFLTIKDKHILLYEHNAFTSHLMLDSDEVYQMTKRGLDAAQIAAAKGIHLNLVLVKLLELHHLGYDLRHYHAQHHAFIKQFNLPAHFQFDVAAG
ncbi:helix-turn-helix domain-containing protein [Faecalibacterium prausnitzii]|jgi:transcriptional regulator with XRE-family HTH domain|nr:helix-turn-helix domain-containing protein [Faecalibacterium prausnitzii]